MKPIPDHVREAFILSPVRGVTLESNTTESKEQK